MALVAVSHAFTDSEPELMDLVFDKFGRPIDVTDQFDLLNGRSILKFDISGYKENEWVDIGFFRKGDGSIVCGTAENLIKLSL